ncbi:MAG TPA: hypothetical protein VF265_01920 [Nevskiaceae bacterium]
MAITARGLKSLGPGQWVAESARGEGQLRAKGGPHAIHFYFRYRRQDRRYDDLPLGKYDPEGKSGITLDDAKVQASALRARYKAGESNLRSGFAHRRALRPGFPATIGRAESSSIVERTLGALMIAYMDQLTHDHKPSGLAIRREVRHNIQEPWPQLWDTPLDSLDADALLPIVAAPAQAGHLRQAEKTRAYLRAAFAAGMKARHNANAIPALRELQVRVNPARDLTPIEGANRARDRALTVAELMAYWKAIQVGQWTATLRFHLLTGCQRIAQLGRVVTQNFDPDTQSILLLDNKGRRTRARKHYVPLIKPALDAMQAMHGGLAGPYLFTFTAGRSPVLFSPFDRRVKEVGDLMANRGELPGGSFTPGDLRRSVETALSGLHVPKEVRAHLQSHGLGGVQERHYDRYEYMDEKREALKSLYRLLTGQNA